MHKSGEYLANKLAALRSWVREEFALPRWLKSLGRDRTPDLDIGPGYLQRWWIIPRNPLFNIYLHRFGRSDDDRALHDHPWPNLSVVLSGEYLEHVPDLAKMRTPHVRLVDVPLVARRRRRCALVFRSATQAHRIELVAGVVWTLFFTGPVLRDWGFHCPQGWRHWRVFTHPANKGLVGRGCE